MEKDEYWLKCDLCREPMKPGAPGFRLEWGLVDEGGETIDGGDTEAILCSQDCLLEFVKTQQLDTH